MRQGSARAWGIVGAAFIVCAVAIAIAYAKRRPMPLPPAPAPATQPATRPTSAPSTAPAQPPPPHDYMSLLLARKPDFPTTQPLIIPLSDLKDAAHIVFTDPVYLDPGGQLWITHPDAAPIARVLGDVKFGGEQTHVTRDRVVFRFDSPDDQGKLQASVILARPDGSFELVNRTGRIDVGTPERKYQWDRAEYWGLNNGEWVIITPTDRGIAILRPQSRPIEVYRDLLDENNRDPTSLPTTAPTTQPTSQPLHAKPQFVLDLRGVIAWVPWENGRHGSHGAARYVDGKWSPLDPEHGNWPEKLVHLIPLSDGTMLRLSLSDDDLSVQTSLAMLESPDVDPKPIEALVAQLSDDDPKVRERAHDELSRYGPGAFPILEKLHDDQPPEAKRRIEQLLAAKLRPTIGRFVLEEGRAVVVGRFGQGLLMWTEAGVSMPDPTNPTAQPRAIAPAWVCNLPGNPAPAELAPPALVAELVPDLARVECVPTSDGYEWFSIHPVNGPMRLLGNHLEPVLRKSERAYRHVVGRDARGRWLFRKEPSDGTTLVLDVTLPDATPRLPAWPYPVPGGTVGWTAEGWPVIKSGGAWVIDKFGTRALDEKRERMFTDMSEMPPTTRPATTRSSATHPTTTASTAPTSLPSEPPILTDSTGGEYFGGQTSLTYVAPDGRVIEWPLPPSAVGSGEVHLIEAEHHLFLFNEPGRVLRIKRTDRPAEPFVLEATFTRNVPNVDHPTRLWLDPAGRIVIAYEGDKLTILFPSGLIPPEIASRMLESDRKLNEEEE